MPTAPTKNSKARPALAAALSLLASVAFAAKAPQPQDLLDTVLNAPDIEYQGRTMITQWFGKQAHAEEMEVYRGKDNRARREFLAPDGRVRRVIVSDGETERIYVPGSRKIYAGDAARTNEKIMPADEERALLLANYDLSVSGPETVAGRPTWVLNFKPKDAGKPSQRIWVDEQTGVTLENKRFLPRGSFAAMSRFVNFTPREDLNDALFSFKESTAAVVHSQGLEPIFMSLDQLNAATGRNSNFPQQLPGGFQFESADYMTIGKNTVRQARYTDGLAIVSIFETDRPVRLPKPDARQLYDPAQGAGALRLSASAKVLGWRRGRENFTIMSDVSRELLLAISASLK